MQVIAAVNYNILIKANIYYVVLPVICILLKAFPSLVPVFVSIFYGEFVPPPFSLSLSCIFGVLNCCQWDSYLYGLWLCWVIFLLFIKLLILSWLLHFCSYDLANSEWSKCLEGKICSNCVIVSFSRNEVTETLFCDLLFSETIVNFSWLWIFSLVIISNLTVKFTELLLSYLA